jgi:hypothetical protein
MPRAACALLLAVAGLGGACGGADGPPTPVATPIGVGPSFHPRALSSAARAARPVGGLRCRQRPGARVGVHVELFARRRVVIVPAGIGIAPPHRRAGPYVRGGRCSYPLRTREPTGVVEVTTGGRALTLGDLFAVWGQPLSATRIASFRGSVAAFVGGVRRPGDPRDIPLRPHAQIVLEVGGYVPPHRRYRFPPGL